MSYKRKPHKACVVCNVKFESLDARKACSDECSAALYKRTAAEYRTRHLRRIQNRNREKMREKRGTDPAKFMENRDPEAMKARERERWRRGQAAHRAREAADADRQ